jgi:thioredoxin-like negative regulator of GroEL
MSKKVFMLSTSRCGYCNRAKDMIQREYPDIGDGFRYFLYDVENIDDEAAMVLDFAKSMNVRGVPFTVLFKDEKIINAVRGFNEDTIKSFVEETISSQEELKDTNGGENGFDSKTLN